MIDERINQKLSELESTLRNVESAREQVHSTVSSFNGLTHTTQEYVGELGNIVREVKELVDSIVQDYNNNKKILKYCLAVNIVSLLVAITVMVFLLLK